MNAAEWARALIITASLSALIVTALLFEIRHRTRQLAKVAAVAPTAVNWWLVLEAIIQELQPLPQADVAKLQQALNDLRKMIPPTQGEK